MKKTPLNLVRRRRLISFLILLIAGSGFYANTQFDNWQHSRGIATPATTQILGESVNDQPLAMAVLETLPIKGRSPKTGYTRSQFGNGWANVDGCDMRNRILDRDLVDTSLSDNLCVVLSGKLIDPYTGVTIEFTRGSSTSDAVQIDHVVALSDAWQKGAQSLSAEARLTFSNDPLNLLAVDGPANQKKGDSDAASWLPDNKSYRCRYVARQVAVKEKYELWVTKAEYEAIKRVLKTCSEQRLPITIEDEQ